jgi:hypothetical protein
VTFDPVRNPYEPIVGLNGIGLNQGSMYIGVSGADPQTSPQACFWDAAGTQAITQPVSIVGGYPMRNGTPAQVFTDPTYSIRVRDRNGVQVFYVAAAGAAAATAADIDFIQAGAGAVTRTMQDKAREIVSIFDYYVDTDPDYSAAMTRAETYLATLGGGTILLPKVQEYPMNWVCLTSNIVVEMVGGDAENNADCIRPASLATAPITFGNGVLEVRHSGLRRCHVSGADDTVAGVTEAAHNAPQAVRVRGGVVFLETDTCVLYNGLLTLDFAPVNTAQGPITGYRDLGSVIRNDIADSAAARCVRAERLGANTGYFTDNKFYGTKLNGPVLGYAAEYIGTAAAITAEFFGSYWDVRPALGLYLVGAATVASLDLQIDPGTTGVVIVETDQLSKNIGQYFMGTFIASGQLMRFGDASTLTFPSGMNTFADTAAFYQPYAIVRMYISSSTNPVDATIYLEHGGANVLNLFGASLYIRRDLRIYGGNAAASGSITSDSGSGGLYIEAIGTNQNIRLVPTGTGFVRLGGASTRPTSDNALDHGVATFRWANSFATQFRPGAGTVIWTSGTGTPEGAVTAPVGSLFTRTDGGAATTLYVKETGSGNTGWAAK